MTERRDGHSKLIWEKGAQAFKTVDPHPETAKPVMTWRPIESAPKDGTVVDLWSPKLRRMASFHWQKYSGWANKPPFESWSGPGGFGPFALQYPPESCPDAQPTHWMPLPDPPVQP